MRTVSRFIPAYAGSKGPLPLFLLAIGVSAVGCGGGGGAATPPLPPPPSSGSVSVSVTPSNASVLLGDNQSFVATVSNSPDTAVAWSVNGIVGGNSAVGTVTSNGLYAAPAILPSSSSVQVTAISHADPTKSASASLVISSDIALSISPSAPVVELGAAQIFLPTLASAGHPDPNLVWAVNGIPGGNSSVGFVSTSGVYTAPSILPSPSSVTVAVQSVADRSKQASVSLTITSTFALQISAPGSVSPGATAPLLATIVPVPGSNPNLMVSWSVSGTGCTGSACGSVTPVVTEAAGAASVASTASYSAPNLPPTPDTITITAVAQADPSKKAQAVIAILAASGVTLSPSTATLAVNHRVTLSAQLSGSAGSGVAWSVNGISGGNSSVGQICLLASNPCQPVTSPATLQVDYLAPAGIPAANPVSVQATSIADPSSNASAQIAVINHPLVTVQPASVTLSAGRVQAFTATVLGASNQSVVWQIQGAACSVSGACGAITPAGIYTAPASAPVPNTLQVVAISSDDTSQSGIASVTISTGAGILALHPASVYAGGPAGFTLRVEGFSFAPTSPGPGAVLFIGGTSRTTSCPSASQCSAPIAPADVAAPGNLSVQIQNPAGTTSNAVSLRILAPPSADEMIPLTSAAPAATGKDIVVVDPTTAGVSVPGSAVDLNVGALGAFDTAANSCSLAGNAIPLARPASGVSTADVCLFSQSGLDTSMAYTVSGPGDVSVIAKQPAGLGIIHLTLQIPSTAQPGARTLFIQNLNFDKTAATGALEVQ